MSWGRYRALVVVPPGPVVTPADVPGSHAADDATVAALIAAATAEIDGPAGWLGRAIGPQTIELRADEFCWYDRFLLPYPPAIEMISVAYVDESEVEQTIDAAEYGLAGQRLYAKPAFTYPRIGLAYEGVRVRYRAGYDGPINGSPPGTTGDVPAPIKRWIIRRATQLVAARTADPLVRSETTNDLDSVTYANPADFDALDPGDPIWLYKTYD